MFKKIFVSVLIVIIVGAVAFSAYNTYQARNSQVASDNTSNTTTMTQNQAGANTNAGNGQGYQGGQTVDNQSDNTTADSNIQHTELAAIPASEVSDAEAESLVYMFEEEKLAHDVYITLNEAWDLATFQNIASSEQMHMDAIQALLDRYGLQTSSNPVGIFTNPELQTLYQELVTRGNQSLAEAIKVGGAIEEIDILDLQTRLAETDNADIQQVYSSLLNGSINHLQAYASALVRQTGETYQPQYMNIEAYQAISSQAMGNGYGNGSSGGNGGNSGNSGQGQQGAGGQGANSSGQGGGKGYRGGRQ